MAIDSETDEKFKFRAEMSIERDPLSILKDLHKRFRPLSMDNGYIIVPYIPFVQEFIVLLYSQYTTSTDVLKWYTRKIFDPKELRS